jgi:anthranilate/para-aminobenzoate synthase component II
MAETTTHGTRADTYKERNTSTYKNTYRYADKWTQAHTGTCTHGQTQVNTGIYRDIHSNRYKNIATRTHTQRDTEVKADDVHKQTEMSVKVRIDKFLAVMETKNKNTWA